MLRYSIKRILLALLTVLIIAAITFFAMNAIPGGPFSSEKAIDPATLAALEARYGLDKPLGEQFVNYLRNLLHGDLGVSLKTGREISDVIGESFGVSARLGLMAALIAVVAGLVLGSIAALCRGKWPDRIIIFITTLFVSVPSFVLATILLLVFCLQLKWVGVWSTSNPNYVLPVLSLAMYPMAYITRLTKSSMLDVLGQDYIRTARAKGLSERKVIYHHPDWLHGGGDRVHHRRPRHPVRQIHQQSGLSHDHGDHDLSGGSDGSGHPAERPGLQAGRPAHQTGLRRNAP